MTYYEAERKRSAIESSTDDIELFENDDTYIECLELMEWVERQISLYANRIKNEERIKNYSENLKGIDIDLFS